MGLFFIFCFCVVAIIVAIKAFLKADEAAKVVERLEDRISALSDRIDRLRQILANQVPDAEWPKTEPAPPQKEKEVKAVIIPPPKVAEKKIIPEPAPLTPEKKIAEPTATGQELKDKGLGLKPPEAIFPEPTTPPEKKVPTPPPAPKPLAPPRPEVPASPPAAKPEPQLWSRFEEAVGKRWLTWVGAFALFLAAGFFVKYAFDNHWLGPRARIALGIITGIILLGVGQRFIKRKMAALGQGLLGGGLAILYVSLFAGFSIYKVIPQPLAFAAMIIVTIIGMILAITNDAIAISILAMLGGFLTPVMVSTGKDARDVLFAYTTLLDLGVLGVAFFKRWRNLDLLAFIGTFVLFSGWYYKFYQAPAVAPTMAWLLVFFMIFMFVPFVYYLRSKEPITLERFIIELANATVVFTYGFYILYSEHRHTLGFIALFFSACYLSLGTLSRKRIPRDAIALFGFVALSVIFLTMAVPLHFELHGITLLWAAEGPALLYLGFRYKYFPVRVAGAIVLVLAAARLFVNHYPFHAEIFSPIFNKNFMTALYVTAAVGIFALVHFRFEKAGEEADQAIKIITGIAFGFLALIILSIEISEYYYFSSHQSWQDSFPAMLLIELVWTAGAGGFLLGGKIFRSRISNWTGIVPLLTAICLLIRFYSLDPGADDRLFFNLRFAIAASIILMSFIYVYMMAREKEMHRETWIVPGYLALTILSAEIITHFSRTGYVYWHGNYRALILLALVHILGAASFLAAGVGLRSRAGRWAGLLPLAISLMILSQYYSLGSSLDYRLFLNPRFCIGLAIILLGFVYCWSLGRNRDAPRDITICAGFLTLVILSAEIIKFYHLKTRLHWFESSPSLTGLILVYILGASGFLSAGMRWRSSPARSAGLAPLLASLLLLIPYYLIDTGGSYYIFANLRFFISMLVLMVSFFYLYSLKRQKESSLAGMILLGYFALFILSEEIVRFLYHLGYVQWFKNYNAVAYLVLVWSLGGLIFLLAGVKFKSRDTRWAGLGPLLVSIILLIRLYLIKSEDYYLFLNIRFFLALAAAVLNFVFVALLNRFRDPESNDERQAIRFFYAFSVLALLVLLSVENYIYFEHKFVNRTKAYNVAQMSLSIVWGLYALSSLVVGFWRRIRNLRLAALGLFGLSALKLIVVDMASVHQLYRIISFFVLGLLLIGASYLYHLVEKRLEAAGGPKTGNP